MKGLEITIGDRILNCVLEQGPIHFLVSNNNNTSEWMAVGTDLGVQQVVWGNNQLSENETIKVNILDIEKEHSTEPVQRKAINKESILGEMKRIKELLTANGFEL